MIGSDFGQHGFPICCAEFLQPQLQTMALAHKVAISGGTLQAAGLLICLQGRLDKFSSGPDVFIYDCFLNWA